MQTETCVGTGAANAPSPTNVTNLDDIRAALRRLLRTPGIEPELIDISTAERSAQLAAEAGADDARGERQAREAIRRAPDDPLAHDEMARVFAMSQQWSASAYHYRQALELSGPPRGPVLLMRLAFCLKTLGRMQEARALYQAALQASPDSVRALVGLAALEEADRHPGDSLAILERAEAVSPGSPYVRRARATAMARLGDHSGAVALLEGLTTDNAEFDAEVVLERGRLLDRLGRYDDAFAAFVEGKRRLRAATGCSYEAEHVTQLTARLKLFFAPHRVPSLPRASVREDVPQPIFVLGFARSGTTLMEQTLASHPNIAGAGDLGIICETVAALPRLLGSPLSHPEALADLWMHDRQADIETLRNYYLNRVRQRVTIPDGCRWFADQGTMAEIQVGLISLLFPQSPMIHMVRHPLDVVLSMFSHPLRHAYNCAYDLESIARHYVAIMDVVDATVCHLDARYLRVRYEDVVDNQTATIGRVLEFVGADYDARCLAFHENTRYAQTFSYAQVSEKLYDRSRYRYRHYLRHLAPVLPILAPVIERLGYAV